MGQSATAIGIVFLMLFSPASSHSPSRASGASTAFSFARPVCTLAHAKPGAKPLTPTLPPTATNNDALDIVAVGISSKGKTLSVTFKVTSLTDGPGGLPMLSGNEEGWYFEFQPTPDDPWYFEGVNYGVDTNSVLPNYTAASDNSKAHFWAWDGVDSSTPGDPSNQYTLKDLGIPVSVNTAQGLITVSAQLANVGLNPGDVITNVHAKAIEMDGGDIYWNDALPVGAQPENVVKDVPVPNYKIGTAC